MSPKSDIRELKVWVCGAIAFDAAVTTLLVTIFNVDLVKTTIATTATTIVALAIVWLIHRSEARNRNELRRHIEDSKAIVSEIKECLSETNYNLTEIRRDTLRIQLSQYVKDQPNNIDTIIKIAEKYFVTLKGDWYMTSEFKKWAKAHDIEVPPIITTAMIENEQL